MTKARDIADNAGQGGGGGQNVVINGQFEISQRGTSFTNIGSGGGGTSGYDDTWTMDRFLISQGQSAGRCSVEQSSDTPDGFSKSLKISTTTADTSIGGAEYHRLQTKFEGQNLQRFAKGTSGAKEFTLSFYCKANANATYAVELLDTDNTRSVSKTFSVTTNWTRVIVTFPADTTGAFNNDNNLSMELNWWMHAGSTYGGGTLQTTWGASVAANRAVGIDSIFDSTSRTFFITGVQLQAGDKASDFEHEHISETENKCKRYYNVYGRSTGTNQGSSAHAGWCYGTTGGSIRIPSVGGPQMRIRPSLGLVGTTSSSAGAGGTMGVYTSGAWQAAGGQTWYATDASLDPTFRIDFNVSSGLPSDGCAGVYFYSSSIYPTDSSFAGVTLDAEL